MVRTSPNRIFKGNNMAADKAPANAMDYPAHERSYDRFLGMFKYGTIAAAIAGAFVVYVIAN